MNFLNLLGFYVWCNMHWPVRPEFLLPIDFNRTRYRLEFILRHPKFWYRSTGTWGQLKARKCWMKGEPAPAEMNIYDWIPF